MKGTWVDYLAIALAGAVVCLAGCASTQKAEKSIASLKETREELVEGKNNIGNAAVALNSLSAPKEGNLKDPYEEFVSEVERIEKRAEKVRELVDELGENSDLYFQEWEKELASFQSQELKQVSEQRLAGTRAAFQPIAAGLEQANKAFTPYLAELKDIRRYLDLDLTPASVTAIGDRISRSIQGGEAVGRAIDEAIRAIDRAGAAISPTK